MTVACTPKESTRTGGVTPSAFQPRFHQELDHWRVAHRHDSHHGLCDYATNSSARNNRASDGEAVDDARDMFATACRSLVVHSDQHQKALLRTRPTPTSKIRRS